MADSKAKSKPVLIYGAYGYSGVLILELAIQRGLQIVIGGRNEMKCSELAKKYKIPYVVFNLDQSNSAIDEQLRKADVMAILSCAGPFIDTADRMIAACLRNGLHYLDITAEINVFEKAAALNQEAKDAKIMIMPGTGHDVVPTDCLAARLKKRLPTANHLSLAMGAIRESGKSPISHGTILTIITQFTEPKKARREGKIIPVNVERKVTIPREKEGEYVKMWGTSLPAGDISSAYHSTGIPNITFYAAFTPIQRWIFWLFSLSFIRWILGSSPVQRFLKSIVPQGGPSEHHREYSRVGLWGEVVDDKNGKMAVTFLRTDEPYKATALCSVAILQRVVAGEAPIGYQTPATAYGEDFITKVQGGNSTWEDLDIETIPKA